MKKRAGWGVQTAAFLGWRLNSALISNNITVLMWKTAGLIGKQLSADKIITLTNQLTRLTFQTFHYYC